MLNLLNSIYWIFRNNLNKLNDASLIFESGFNRITEIFPVSHSLEPNIIPYLNRSQLRNYSFAIYVSTFLG